MQTSKVSVGFPYKGYCYLVCNSIQQIQERMKTSLPCKKKNIYFYDSKTRKGIGQICLEMESESPTPDKTVLSWLP